jgi:hypothetical protein
MATVVPRIIYTFWHDSELPEFVATCVDALRRRAVGWDVRVLHGDEPSLAAPPVSVSTLSPALLSDWYRLTALRATGGAYIDASCIVLASPDEWVDTCSATLQGWSCRLDGETMESWAVRVRG